MATCKLLENGAEVSDWSHLPAPLSLIRSQAGDADANAVFIVFINRLNKFLCLVDVGQLGEGELVAIDNRRSMLVYVAK